MILQGTWGHRTVGAQDSDTVGGLGAQDSDIAGDSGATGQCYCGG